MNAEDLKDTQNVKDVIKTVREINGWSGNEFAKKLKLGSSTSVYKWEKGEVRPSYNMFNRVLDLVPLSSDDKQAILKQHHYHSEKEARRVSLYQTHARAIVSRFATKEDLNFLLKVIDVRLEDDSKDLSSFLGLNGLLPLSLSRASVEEEKFIKNYLSHTKIFIEELANEKQLLELKKRIEIMLEE